MNDGAAGPLLLLVAAICTLGPPAVVALVLLLQHWQRREDAVAVRARAQSDRGDDGEREVPSSTDR